MTFFDSKVSKFLIDDTGSVQRDLSAFLADVRLKLVYRLHDLLRDSKVSKFLIDDSGTACSCDLSALDFPPGGGPVARGTF